MGENIASGTAVTVGFSCWVFLLSMQAEANILRCFLSNRTALYRHANTRASLGLDLAVTEEKSGCKQEVRMRVSTCGRTRGGQPARGARTMALMPFRSRVNSPPSASGGEQKRFAPFRHTRTSACLAGLHRAVLLVV